MSIILITSKSLCYYYTLYTLKVRDLEQQLSQLSQRKQLGDFSLEEEIMRLGGLQKTQDRNISHIRNIEKERKETLEVVKMY